MASADWTVLTDSIDIATIRRGVTSGITVPNGGGSFTYGFHSLSAGHNGTSGLFYNAVNFAPMAKGGRVTGAVQRMASGGNTSFAAFLFIGLQGSSVNNNGYILGLQDDDPSYLVLRKGALVGGLPSGTPGSNGILRRSTNAVAIGEWAHIRLDMTVNGTGDVILSCKKSDLGADLVTAPVWTTIPGMTDYTDDALGIASGSLPYTSGRAGFGFYSKDVTRRATFDHLTVERQL